MNEKLTKKEKDADLTQKVLTHANELNKANKKIKQLKQDLESDIEDFVKKLNTYKDVDLNIAKTMKVLCSTIKLLSYPEYKNVKISLQYDLKTSYAKYLSRSCFSEEEKIFYITSIC